MKAYEKYYQDQQNSLLRMPIFAYSPPSDGMIRISGKHVFLGTDFRTAERYKEYAECGFNVLHTQSTGTYVGEEWETCKTKRVMDAAYEGGVDKVIVSDDRVYWLSRAENGLFGDEEFAADVQFYGKRKKQFKDEAELDEYLRWCLAPYINHPAFYGVHLVDEPRHTLFPAIGQVYRALKRVCPKIYIMCNLFPMITLNATNYFFPGTGSLFDRFKGYLNGFIDATGADYIQFDMYPFSVEQIPNSGEAMHRLYVKAVQIASEVARERDVDFCMVAQSFSMYKGGRLSTRLPEEDEMEWQQNLLLGMGIKRLAYYTYWSSAYKDIYGEFRPPDGAIMSDTGERTRLYPVVQRLNAIIAKLSPVILNFKLKKMQFFIQPPMMTHTFYLENINQEYVEKVTMSALSHDVAFIFEHYDEKRKQYMHVVMNGAQPYYKGNLENVNQTIELQFSKEFSKIDVFCGNEWKTVDLVDGKYTTQLQPGQAEYILPY